MNARVLLLILPLVIQDDDVERDLACIVYGALPPQYIVKCFAFGFGVSTWHDSVVIVKVAFVRDAASLPSTFFFTPIKHSK